MPETTLFTVPSEICRDFERSSRLEWLETNHTGAFAMGTVAGVNTRRYHSLLVASLNPPADRFSILPRVEESVTIAGESFNLATVQYPGAVQPRGFDLLQEFTRNPFPVWRYRCGSALISKTICLLDAQQTVLLQYESTHACRLDLRLFLAFRDYHGLAHQNSALLNKTAEDTGRLSFAPYPDLPALTVFHCGTFHSDGLWFLNHEYLRELERGLDFREDLFSPGALHYDIDAAHPAWFIASLEAQPFYSHISASDISSLLAREAGRRQCNASNPLQSTLVQALDQFRLTRFDGRRSLLAGYPWFTDWSRDTLISLPALSIAGFPERETKEILQMVIEERSQGLVPNRFSDRRSQPEYNTADASLWFFVAAREYLTNTNDLDFLQTSLYPAATDIVNWHEHGTHYDIHVDPADHLLWAGNPDTQLTWMDARVAGAPVTSRYGKAVEVNALWYNALCIAAAWAQLLNFAEDHKQFQRKAELVQASFQEQFWNEERGCLYDVITPSFRDGRLRPNQLFALSLPFPLLDRTRARKIVDLVNNQLLTPVGVRTLAPADPFYRPRFAGSMAERDSDYHQGTAWPWLTGPFIAAYLYAYGESEQTIAFGRQILSGLERELSACCLGSLSEVYDGDPPQRPGGCPAQLWSVAQFIIALRRLGCWKSR